MGRGGTWGDRRVPIERANGPTGGVFFELPDVPAPPLAGGRREPITGLPSSDFLPGVDFLDESPEASTLAAGILRFGFTMILLGFKLQ